VRAELSLSGSSLTLNNGELTARNGYNRELLYFPGLLVVAFKLKASVHLTQASTSNHCSTLPLDDVSKNRITSEAVVLI
jgi:hypothetical protein